MTARSADALNQNCACEVSTDHAMPGFHSRLPVFVDSAQVGAMQAIVAAVHRVTGSASYQAAVLESASSVIQVNPRTRGVFDGYDFHSSGAGSSDRASPDRGPKLIEINTNAGGAMINVAAQWRHPTCCDPSSSGFRMQPGRAELETAFLSMFRAEWRLARGDAPLRSIAIVDDDPAGQFLFPEFQLFAQLFAAHGLQAFIADARELEYSAGALRWQGKGIDLVYNRLTDFQLEQPAHEALRRAYLEDAAVVTPHPRAHALRADKRVLTRLSDPDFLRSVGASEADQATLLSGIPRTRPVENGVDWWPDRKNWFFKPAQGFGSRGAYRGDKITRRVWGEVSKGGYVAQQFVAPGERLRTGTDDATPFKVDLRVYAYDGHAQLLAARLYQGQTTNFRTPGGGFAAVLQTSQ